MLRLLRLLRLLLPLVCLPLALRAQDFWTAFPQDLTRANLWSIAYGSDTLVVAGEQGTILTYNFTDQAWLPRASGNTLWLVGAGFGNGRFIIVGDQGTILTSDDAGATWTPRVSGTTIRLNAVAFGGGRWLAVGEQGALLVSTDNGTTWAPRPALGTGFLRGLAYGQGQFLIGGAGGALYRTTDAATFTSIPLGTTSDVEGIAIGTDRFWLVGSNGLHATATQPTAWTIDPTFNTSTLRGVVVRNDFEASAIGDRWAEAYLVAPTNAWRSAFGLFQFLGTAIARTPTEVIGVGFGGNIVRSRMESQAWLRASPPGNVRYGEDVRFSVLSGRAPQGYQWQRDGVDIAGATQPEYVLRGATPATVGAISVRLTFTESPTSFTLGPRQLNLLPAGRPELRDTGFTSALPTVPNLVVPQPDGKVLVAGFVTNSAERVSNGLTRLNADGSVDTGFLIGAGIPRLGTVEAVHLHTDGTIYVRGTFASIDNRPLARLARLRADGSVDLSFSPDPAVAAAITGSKLSRDGRLYVQLLGPSNSTRIVRLDASGALDSGFAPVNDARLIAVDWTGGVLAHHTAAFSTPYLFARYLPDGTRDASYQSRILSYTLGFAEPFVATQVTAQGLYYTSATYGKFGGLYTYSKLLPDGRSDSTYVSPPAPPYPAMLPFSYTYRPDGGLWQIRRDVSGTLATAYGPDGRLDATQYATLPELAAHRILAAAPDGALYVTLTDSPTEGAQEFVRLRPAMGRAGRLTNLSVRAFVPSAAEPLIAGFVTAGAGASRVLLRGIGPSLVPFGVTDPLRDPQLAFTRNGARLDGNDDWSSALAPRFTAVGAFPLASGSKDAALESPVADGDFTGVVAPPPGESGTALVEFYESTDDLAGPRRFINVSARGPVAAGRPLISGFNITGEVPVTVLIRAAGPALTAFGVPNVLADPRLTLYRGQTALWENDNWAGQSIPTPGFPFAPLSRDSAMLVTLAPGSYTAVVTGPPNATGTALIEVYEMP